jgi:type 1 fimbria pilin
MIIAFSSCDNEEENGMITLKFTHNWDGIPVTNQDFNDLKFTNANGEKVSIERFRYLISNINIINSKNYLLVNLKDNSGTEITITDLQKGTAALKFTFGFEDADNIDGIYQDLNSVSFNVPGMLGGGYHFMQFDGKYKDINNQDANFNYHAIRAVDKTDPDNLVLQDTSFEVNLGIIEIANSTTVEIKVNIAEWFTNPNTWNLNELNTVLMPNFEAQKMMSANGKSVFSLGKVTQ